MVNTEYFSYTDAMKYMGIKSPVTFREYVRRGLPIIVIGLANPSVSVRPLLTSS